ncbi:MAG: DUF4422 domain-containing protein [Roseburia sp.]|nr:DUF4422 domain-containing protein [Roseburia sp.]
MSVRIFAMTHKRFAVPNDPMYIPLHVGHAEAKEDLGYRGDDTGDNISALNCYYAELSGVYWVWKNFHAAEYVGVCHYRRFLTDEAGYAFSEREYEALFREYDIVTTKQLELPNSYHHGFSAHHGSGPLDETGNIIRERHPEYYDTFVRLVSGNKTYFGNIMVAPKALFDAYAAWLFDILFALQKRTNLTFTDDYHRRVFGFISEFLLYVWVTARGLRACECRVAIIGEKTETREIKERMAVFFRDGDARGAREYFAECLKARPDVLMEASDITGECKLCLQAVSTANLELEAYGHCFLERLREYEEIIRFFRGVNEAALKIIRDSTERQPSDSGVAAWLAQEQSSERAAWTEQRQPSECAAWTEREQPSERAAWTERQPSDSSIAAWLTQNQVSGIALRAAVRIHAPNDAALQRAYRAVEWMEAENAAR